MRFHLALVLLALVAGLWALPVQAQGVQGTGKHERRQENAARDREDRRQPGKNPNRDLRQMGGLPPRWMERLQQMNPADQERFFRNNEHFKNLPPERQAQIRHRLEKWNSLTPEQQQRMRDNRKIWEQMSPDQQRHFREDILPKWQLMPLDRRQAITRRLHALGNMSESERQARLNDEEFLRGLSPEDREMLRELNNLRVGSAPEPPPEVP